MCSPDRPRSSDFIGIYPDYRPMATGTLAKGKGGSAIGEPIGSIDRPRRARIFQDALETHPWIVIEERTDHDSTDSPTAGNL